MSYRRHRESFKDTHAAKIINNNTQQQKLSRARRTTSAEQARVKFTTSLLLRKINPKSMSYDSALHSSSHNQYDNHKLVNIVAY